MKCYAKDQPKDGDTVLHCGHLHERRHHFLKAADGGFLQAIRPDGTRVSARWIIQCGECFVKGAHPTIRADTRWIGNEPLILDVRGH